MFERAAQVNARFVAESCRREEIIEALYGLGLARNQITILDHSVPRVDPQASGSSGLLAQLRKFLGGEAASPARAVAPREVQFMVYMGQDDRLVAPVLEVFRRFDPVAVEHFSPTSTAQRLFGSPSLVQDMATPTAAPPAAAPTALTLAAAAPVVEGQRDDDAAPAAASREQRTPN